MKVERWQLKQRQAYDLDLKIRFSTRAIINWYEYWEGQVYVAFSGGKDSTVLLHLVRQTYPRVPGVFIDTGLEYPEIRQFVKETDNVIWLKPKMRFDEVIKKYGYPIISKEVSRDVSVVKNKPFGITSQKFDPLSAHSIKYGKGFCIEKYKYLIDSPFKISPMCCNKLKKDPTKEWEKMSSFKPLVGMTTSDSRLREMVYLEKGCNSFVSKRPISNPIAFWKEEDIWTYIKREGLLYSAIYDLGYDRTGCMFCMFGVHLGKLPNKFQLMKQTHPKIWNYCINELNLREPLDYIGVPYE